MNMRNRSLGTVSALAVAVSASLLMAGGAMAQVTTSTLRGTVFEGAAAQGGGTLVARDVSTGFTSRTTVNAQGGYVLPGLRPGTYEITVTSPGGQTTTDTVTLGLGQQATLDLDLATASVVGLADANEANLGEIVVTGRRLFEVRTPEVATNVTQQQINNLPQVDRNFLNFAALAPGVVVSSDPQERTIYAGSQTANAINVFIDGQSQKSNILDGGFIGQDDSRGNPFPQGAVREFRVVTQNFKAEYEQASSAIITAVTRSGTNEFSGDLYVTYQGSDWRSQDVFSQRRGQERPDLERLQWGGSLSGPIIQDRVHFLASYERKDETRSNAVFLNRTEFNDFFANDLGVFSAPFEQDLFFGKVSWQVDDRQIVDVSGTYRTEFDTRGFGFQDARTRAILQEGDTRSFQVRHQFQTSQFLNIFAIDFLRAKYNPQAENFDLSGEAFLAYRDGDTSTPTVFDFRYTANDFVFNRGGGGNNQDIEDESFTLRNDLTFTEIEFGGRHIVKLGGKYSRRNYYVAKDFNRNPQFNYDITANPLIFGRNDIPTQVFLNEPVEPADVQNTQVGFYIQDDWQVNDRLEINLGLRWDYETDAVNNSWTTPDEVRTLLRQVAAAPLYVRRVDVEDYISDGDRSPFMDAFQPRVGFSYALTEDERTVLFGGAGRYYDRVGFNFVFDERYKLFQRTRNIYFSPNGGTFGGRTDTIRWEERYRNRADLDALLAGVPSRGEVFLINNELKTPYTDQFNLGLRQRFGDIQTAITFSYSKTNDETQWSRLNVDANNQIPTTQRNAAGVVTQQGLRPSDFINPATGQAYAYNDSIFIAVNGREREYRAMYLTIDRPFTNESGYGFNIAYTLADGEQNGSRDTAQTSFDFDYATIADTPWFNTPGVERHRIVASGTLRLPFDVIASSIITLGSGRPFTVFARGPGTRPDWFGQFPDREGFLPGLNFAYRQIDVRLTKGFEVAGQRVEASLDAINLFDFKNYNGYDQTLFNGNNLNTPNPRFGLPTSQALPTRTFVVGLRYSF